MSLAENLRSARKQAGLTQADLSTKIGLTQGAISHIENGTHGISSEALEKWSEACNFEIALIGPAHEESLRLLSALSPPQLSLVVRLLRLLPRLEVAHHITLEGIVETWGRVASSAVDDEVSKAELVRKL